jgi:hypothetical protein
MSEPVWIIERRVASGALRIGVQGYRYAAELNGRRIQFANNDILTLAEIAASRHTARLFPALRDGGYSHLLGGNVGLLPREADQLKSVALGTPEGLILHRAKLVEALKTDIDDRPTGGPAGGPVDAPVLSGLAQHGDEAAREISLARQALRDFDNRHPQVRKDQNNG